MDKLGKPSNPIKFRVQNSDRANELAAICEENNWIFIGGIEPEEEDDISELEYMLNPKAFKKQPKMSQTKSQTVVNKVSIRRNDPCSCGSGLKFKKCCM